MRSLGVAAASGGLLLFCIFPTVFTLKTQDWKTCDKSAFCRRGRALSARAAGASEGSWKSPYSVVPSSVVVDPQQTSFKAAVKSELFPEIKFSLDVQVHKNGVARVRMDEVDGLKKRYDEAASWALAAPPEVAKDVKWQVSKSDVRATYGKGYELRVQYAPLKVVLLKDSVEQLVLNGRGLLHMEHFRTKQEPAPALEGGEAGEQAPLQKEDPRAWFEGAEEDGYWEETFLSWTDSKPKGPESLSLDIDFPNHGHVYGLPQRATTLDLPTTTGPNAFFNEPYRLFNADVFEYVASHSMSLYGSIPFVYAHSAQSTVGVFNAIGSEAWVDLGRPTAGSSTTHWISESGILDVFILPGPTPADVIKQYSKLTGNPALPAHWALGYHQCRWNYISSDDVRGVQKRFDEEDFPVDVFWLDIEYSEEHKYFIWDKKNFPDPVDMINDVAQFERKMVVIIDPHLKRTDNYPVYKKASELEVLVKPASGEGEFEGWCWSGSSSWVDFFNPKSWDWWKSLFKNTQQGDNWSWVESTESVFIWNDMNEPSVFNGPEITMPKDNIHYGGWEHRDVHNINGMLYHQITTEALMERSDPPKRPFVLTRSFYAGSQRYSAMWTGDNMGTWEHMAVGIKMVLANVIGGMSFAGSDVGGFFGNPEPEMLVRWYQVGIFGPFFRAHAHIDTRRREPYLLEEPHKSLVRDIIKLRYSMLPVWYTAFRETSVTGLPVLRPQFMMYPRDEAGFGIDDQYYIGSSGLLVKPVTEQGATETSVYFADKQPYYNYFDGHLYRGGSVNATVPAALHQIPLFIRGGSIVSTRERARRSSPLMKHDPFTLRIALDKSESARGELYLDSGDDYTHQKGDLVWREFEAKKVGKDKLTITSSDLAALYPAAAVDGAVIKYSKSNRYAEEIKQKVRVEKVVLYGLSRLPKGVSVQGGPGLVFDYTPGHAAAGNKEGGASVLVIKDPYVSVTNDWSIVIQY